MGGRDSSARRRSKLGFVKVVYSLCKYIQDVLDHCFRDLKRFILFSEVVVTKKAVE